MGVVPVCSRLSERPLHALLTIIPQEQWPVSYVLVPRDLPGVIQEADGLLHAEVSLPVRWEMIADDEVYASSGCLCCSLRSETGAALGRLFMSLLSRRQPKVSTVYVLTKSEDSAPLKDMVRHSPFLAQRYYISGEAVLG